MLSVLLCATLYWWDMSLSTDSYTLASLVTCGSDSYTFASLVTCGSQAPSKPTYERFGSKHPPLFNIELDHVVDVLHLMLRVTDVMLRNLIWKMVELDIHQRRNCTDNFVALISQEEGICSLLLHSTILYS